MTMLDRDRLDMNSVLRRTPMRHTSVLLYTFLFIANLLQMLSVNCDPAGATGGVSQLANRSSRNPKSKIRTDAIFVSVENCLLVSRVCGCAPRRSIVSPSITEARPAMVSALAGSANRAKAARRVTGRCMEPARIGRLARLAGLRRQSRVATL